MRKYPVVPLTETDINQLGWLTGSWRGHHLQDDVEEIWSRAENGNMMSMYRRFRDGQLLLYSFMTMEQSASGILFRMKHVHPDLRDWDAETIPGEYLLVETNEDTTVFVSTTMPYLWMIYQRKSNGQLLLYFEAENTPSPVEGVFVYGRGE